MTDELIKACDRAIEECNKLQEMYRNASSETILALEQMKHSCNCKKKSWWRIW